MTGTKLAKPVDILLVEDNPGDVRLTREALRAGKILNTLSVAADGVEALAYLRRTGRYAAAPAPDLILLDLNLPRMDGHELLAVVKSDPDLRRIPVVVLSTSQAEKDVAAAYDGHANCYITKPIGLDQLIKVIAALEDFWFTIVRLPNESTRN